MSVSLSARWVTLSACHTARALLRPGEEWFGLARAFMLAGAMLDGLFGVIVHGLSSEADHDGFPAAPPERLR